MTRASSRRSKSTVKVIASAVAGLAVGLSITAAAGLASLRMTASVSSTCADSDGGVAYNTYGAVSGDYDGRWYTHADVCEDNVLYENSCRDGQAIQEAYNCPDGCDNGKCKPPYSDDTGTSCRDSDGGRRFTVRGTITSTYNGRTVSRTDECVGRVLYENECRGNVAEQFSTLCENGCSAGACIDEDTTESCRDSDGGSITNRTGSVTGLQNGHSYSYADQCVDRNHLTEYICRGDRPSQYTDPNSDLVYCKYGCENGRCLDSTTVYGTPHTTYTSDYSCSDTDGGKFYLTRGTIRGTKNGADYAFVDECVNDFEVYEYYCKGSRPLQHLHSCRYGCSSGRCLP